MWYVLILQSPEISVTITGIRSLKKTDIDDACVKQESGDFLFLGIK